MSSYVFLTIATLLVIKPVRNSLFITTFGVSQLPYAFIAVALVAGVFIHFYSKFAARVRLTTLINNTFLASAVCFFGFWLFFSNALENAAIVYVFYVFGTIWGVVTVSQFWLLANELFDARQARRLFSILGAGSIAGGIFGGYLTNFLAPFTGTNNLLLICIGFLAVCMALLFVIQKRNLKHAGTRQQAERPKFSETKSAAQSTVQIVKNSRHLKYMASLVGVSVIVANLVDYQFSAVAAETIQNEDELTAFFGFWLSTLSICSLGIQFVLTGQILKRYGVGASLLFLPIGILVGSVILLITPALWAATFIKVSDGSFKQSINKAGIELLSIPIPGKIKKQAKAFIDVFVDSLATGLGGVALILLTAILGLSTQQISFFVILLVALWLYLIVQVKSAYVNSFRTAIEKRALDFDKEPLKIQDAVVLEGLLNTLETSRSEKQIIFILDALQNTNSDRIVPHVERLLEHKSGEILTRCLTILRRMEISGFEEKIKSFLSHPDKEVREEAIRYQCVFSENAPALLNEYLNRQDVRIQTATLMCAAREYAANSNARESIRIVDLVREVFASLENKRFESEEECSLMKATLADVIGEVNEPELSPYLERLFEDKDANVLAAAIACAGKTRAEQFIDTLLGFLSDKYLRSQAREALANFGESVLDKLARILDAPESDSTTRNAVPKLLAAIGTQDALDILLANLDHHNLLVRDEIVHAVKTIKKERPLLKFNKTVVHQSLLAETKAFNSLLERLSAHVELQSGATQGNGRLAHGQSVKARLLLKRALDEQLENNLERIFDLLGVKYSLRDMESAYKGVRSEKNDLRANAIEFLDNYLDASLKKLIIPLVELYPSRRTSPAREMAAANGAETERENLLALLNGNIVWLKACALFLIGEEGQTNFEADVEALLDDRVPLIRETALFAYQKLQEKGAAA